MTDFFVGQRVKCVSGNDSVRAGNTYTVTDSFVSHLGSKMATVDGGITCYAHRFEPIPSDPTARTEMEDGWFMIAMDDADTIAAKNVSAIYAIQPQCHIPPKPVEQKPVDPRSEGIARAIGNLNSHEPRLGSSRWSPE